MNLSNLSRLSRGVAAFVVVALAGLAPAQDVKFEKYTLPNGMTVILHEDHTLPIVGINTWFHVGAKDEPAGRSGFAHLFEHLMFMGTERVPGSQFDIIMETGGGANNASTSFDRTNYFSNGPSALLPTLLWLDADRLEDLGRTMNLEKLNKQRDVVRNERRQSIENAPYGKAELAITEIMFPAGHPYHYEVIGRHEDLEAATVQDVKDFFGTFYVPNNASLVVSGDFKSDEIKPLVAKLFGTIAKGAEPMHKAAPAQKLGRVVRAVALDQVQLPKIAMCYHSPSQLAEGDAEMDLLGAVLSQGKSSRLYKRLVLDEKLASDVSAYQASSLLQSVFRIDVTAVEGADLDKIEQITDEEVNRLLKEGITSEELEQRKATIELGKLSQLQSPASVADKLNEYEYFWGDPGGFKRDLDRYRNATPETVTNWARKIITQDSRLIMRVLPDQPDRGETPRDQRPKDFAPSAFAPPAPETFTIGSGTQVMLWHKPELPLVSVDFVFTPGGPLDTPAKAGEHTLAAQMMGEGAGPYTASQFADAVQGIGATFNAGAGTESGSVSMTVVKRNFDKAMDLARLALREPTMKADDWERVQRLHIDDLKQASDNPMVVAGRVGQRVLFGDASPYAWPSDGTEATVAKLSLDDIKHAQQHLFSPGHLTVVVAGDVTKDEVSKAMAKLFDGWNGGDARKPASAIAPIASKDLRVVLVDKPGAVQTVIRYVTPGPRAADDKRVAYRLLNTILGGSFTSRLNANLREAHGYTYGAGSRFIMSASTGYFLARASVKADVTGESLKEFAAEFSRIRKGDISESEVTKARETLRTDTIQSFEGVGGTVGTAAGLVIDGLPFESLGQDVAAMQKVGAGELNAMAAAALPIDQGVLVLMGDKDLIKKQIEGLGLPEPVEYTVEGEPVKGSK
ncbi:MAG: pitrilysin family protein [Phycisphaerales bacterium]|jgi:predicted Zn-dependent peptidase